MTKKKMICIVCPKGCNLEVTKDDNTAEGFKVEGAICPRGKEYGIKEVTNPTRMITSTVKISGAHLPRLPVKTDKPIPKEMVMECMKEIDALKVTSPIKEQDILIENIFNTGSNIVATRSMEKI
ncbi:DUF1667 domain-containing protein [Proteinivorax tanatarense]|uniref:DUF1667 domain-containing protein n=1 Tax=Proteinivorax tanatarense TaxID=1260629 RepID=A0AAU7VIY4_9FIRM